MGLGQFGVLEFLLDYLNLNKKSKLGKVEMVMIRRIIRHVCRQFTGFFYFRLVSDSFCDVTSTSG